MNLHIVSDLHLDHHPLAPALLAGDALVVAGDVTDGDLRPLIHWCAPYLRADRPVIFVPGNHEYYGHRHAARLRAMHRQTRAAGIRLLHNAVYHSGSVAIFGTTLWTDFALYGEPLAPIARAAARQQMNDFTYIFEGPNRPLRPETTVRWHDKALRLLRRFLTENPAPTKVVVSHHAPAPGSVHPDFARHALNPAFVNNLTPLLQDCGPALWVHGHTHRSFDYRVGSTRVLANPRGYVSKRALGGGRHVTTRENPRFLDALVVAV